MGERVELVAAELTTVEEGIATGVGIEEGDPFASDVGMKRSIHQEEQPFASGDPSHS